jgi:hypothetical protein
MCVCARGRGGMRWVHVFAGGMFRSQPLAPLMFGGMKGLSVSPDARMCGTLCLTAMALDG